VRALHAPQQRSATVANGEQLSLTDVPGLRRRGAAGSPTVLPKLAVDFVRRGELAHLRRLAALVVAGMVARRVR
jgi:hypothetical protein